MSGLQGKETRRGAFEAPASIAEAERMDMIGPISGQIVDFDPTTQKATVKVNYQPRHNGEPVDMPNLLEVPVQMPRAGGYVFSAPIKAGDGVQLVPQMRDMDNWYLDSGAQQTATQRAFNWSDMIAVPGLNPAAKAMANYDNENVFVGTDDHQNGLRVSPGGTVAIEGNGESLFQILEELLDLLNRDQLQVNYGSSAGTGHELQYRVEYGALRDRLQTMKLR